MIFQIYPTKNKQWAWRLRANNNKIIADSAETYKRVSHCYDMLDKIIAACVNQDYIFETDIKESKNAKRNKKIRGSSTE